MPFILLFKKFQQSNSNNNNNNGRSKRKTPLKVHLKEHITTGAAGNKFYMQLARARFHI